ncbi:uncharacterized protein [Procambarus clarkii]|uniref:uncharacterized protein n=1 Tax=Procambarus clarkii TaxID=6728 RepID=UPI0037432FF2
MQLQVRQNDQTSGRSTETNVEQGKTVKLPKLANFHERGDSMDAYIKRFEGHAADCGWERSKWALALSALLKGKALTIYHSLGPHQRGDYEALTTVMLNGFGIIADRMQENFRRAQLQKGETYVLMLQRLESSLNRYCELMETAPGSMEFYQLMIREKFLKACESSLRVKLKEQEVVSNLSLAKQADLWAGARRQVKGVKPHEKHHATGIGEGAKPKTGVSGEQGNSSNKHVHMCCTCGKPGHRAADCKVKPKSGYIAGVSSSGKIHPNVGKDPLAWTLEEVDGNVNGKSAKIFRDQGATTHMVRKSLVKPGSETGRHIYVKFPNGYAKEIVEVYVWVDTPYIKGKIRAVQQERAVYGLLMGNVPRVSDCPSPPSKKTGDSEEASASAECSHTQSTEAKGDSPGDDVTGSDHTLTQLKNKGEKASCEVMEREAKPLVEATATPLTGNLLVAAVTTRSRDQQADSPRKTFEITRHSRSVAKEFIDVQGSDPTLAQIRRYAEEKKVFQHQERKYWYLHHNGKLVRSVETPHDIWDQLVVPQEHRLAAFRLGHEVVIGHMGHAKTSAQIQAVFYWPGITGKIQCYTRSCDTCQRTTDQRRVKPGKLQPLPIIDQPFKLVSIDLVGPIIPSATDGSKYIQTMVDHATRYPEAAALKNIETSTVAEALVGFFSRLGIPEWIHSNRGIQLYQRNDGPSQTSAHSESILHHAISCYGKRFGRTLHWRSQEEVEENVHRTASGVAQEKLKNTCQLTREQLVKAKEYQKQTYDKKAKECKFNEGDKVLCYFPLARTSSCCSGRAPFTVVECSHSLNYVLDVDGARKKYHDNMLKCYEDPSVDVSTKPKKHRRSHDCEDKMKQMKDEQGVTVVEPGDGGRDGYDLRMVLKRVSIAPFLGIPPSSSNIC